jgi:hypothetical protein
MDRLIEYASSRVQAFLDELGRLKEAEFPYEQARDAVDQIHALFTRKLALLKTLDSRTNPAVIKQQCGVTLEALFLAMPLAGFLLRSTNVRNAFELFRPLLRLAQDVLEPALALGQRKTRLVLSSEWDYSPLSYSEVPDLPGFVLIGLPAPESSNPLLIPLAGHELGHSVWKQGQLAVKFHPAVKKHILDAITRRWTEYRQAFPLLTISTVADLTSDLFAVESWQPALIWSLGQAEEIYCDFFGLQVFGTSYLHAFAYLLAPKAGVRSLEYPDQRRRVRHLLDSARDLGLAVPLNYDALFDDNSFPASYLSPADTFRLSVADEACDDIAGELRREADAAAQKAGIRAKTKGGDEVKRIAARLRRVVPAEHCTSLADIINAAWTVAQEPDLWKDTPELHEKRATILRELVLKNIEIFEIELILAAGRGTVFALAPTPAPTGTTTPPAQSTPPAVTP